MRLQYPSDPLNPKAADSTYLEEYEAARSIGFEISLFSFEDFQGGAFKPRPTLQAGDVVLYRGWMLSVQEFTNLVKALEGVSARPFTSVANYRLCHYLPEWYPALAGVTAETVVLAENTDFVAALSGRDWPGYFVKDYVKSLSTAGGSLVATPGEIEGVVVAMKKYRGVVEGGVCVRRKEEYEPGSERRYFVLRSRPLSADEDVPEIVNFCASRIDSPFFSVDVAQRRDGVLRVVELGDGQVSDRKEWPAEKFVLRLSMLANKSMQPTLNLTR